MIVLQIQHAHRRKKKPLNIGTGGQTMGRLIDAEAFERTVMFGDAEDMQDVIYALRDYPTAYDPDKVVEQLSDKFRVVRTDEDLEWNRAIEKAIEIVKGGGVDGN